MIVRNFTPFPNLRFTGMNNVGVSFGVVVAKGTFSILADGQMGLASEQAPILLTDKYHGDVFTTSLWMPSDLVPYKPRTDVILNAVARAPSGRPQPGWECGVEVSGPHGVRKVLRVTGPRVWEPVWLTLGGDRIGPPESRRLARFKEWRLSPPEPAAEVPIRYELSFGGLLAKSQGVDEQGAERPPYMEPWQHNPIGRGWIDRELSVTDRAWPAPQIESADDPIHQPYATHAPQGVSPIPPDWLPRRPLGGTFDDAWVSSVWPNWPADYDFAYHNSAHSDLVCPGFLDGDETVRMWGLGGGDVPRLVKLPSISLVTGRGHADGEAKRTRMVLDTLLLDVADADPDEHRVFITWRTTFDEATVAEMDLTTASVETARTLHCDAPPTSVQKEPA